MTKQEFIQLAEKVNQYVRELGLICESSISCNESDLYPSYWGFLTIKGENQEGLFFNDAKALQEMISQDLNITLNVKQFNGFYILYKRELGLIK